MHFFEVKIDHPEPMIVLVAELANGSSIEELLDQLYKHANVELTLADVIVLRTPVSRPLDRDVGACIGDENQPWLPSFKCLANDRAKFQESFVRTPARSVHLLFSYNYEHFVSNNINPGSADKRLDNLDFANHASLIDTIRAEEIDFIVDTSRARLPPIPGVAYRAPSGALVPSFLRIGNIQRSRSAIDAIFFWLLPYLKGCEGIITDTWSIGSIALNASRRLVAYRGTTQRVCPVEMLSVYLAGSDAQMAEVGEQIDRLMRLAEENQSEHLETDKDNKKILFLMSGTNTGSLYRRLIEVLTKRGTPMELVRFVALFALGHSRAELPYLRDLSRDGGDGSYATLDPLKSHDELGTIEIDPQTYFPSQYRDILHVIRKAQTRNMTDFLDRYHDSSIFKVHKDSADDGPVRHQAIWVDTITLARHPKFQERFRAKLNGLSPTPKVIVSPPHKAANELAELAIGYLREKRPEIVHVSHPNLWLKGEQSPENEGVAEIINGLSDDDSLLILDDAFISGQRISTYHSHLRHLRFRGRLHYVVAVARPSSLKEWDKRSDLIRFRPPEVTFAREGNTIAAIEKFSLPDWKERDCPWCMEQRQYRAVQIERQPALMQERSSYLDEVKPSGMEDSLFLNPPENTLHFSDCSIFGELGLPQASVFASVASALQMLRSEQVGDKALLGPRDYPIATVLNFKEYLDDVYTDSFLRACIIRAARDHELVYTDQHTEIERCDAAAVLLASTEVTKNDLAAELTLAFREGKFPFLDLDTESAETAIQRLKLNQLFDGFDRKLEMSR